MKQSVSKLRSARGVLLAGAALGMAMLPAATAMAQDQIEEIVVTGSRIRTSNVTSPAPLTVLGQEELARSGQTNFADILRNLPSYAGASTGRQTSNGSVGVEYANLRGLGSQRTLVMINGRRAVAGGTGADSSVDLTSIPMAAIERVEVLRDGASAVYGSDAVAGVINIITKEDFEGVDLQVERGIATPAWDGQTFHAQGLIGANFDRGNVTGYFDYNDRRGIRSGSEGRSFSNCQFSELGGGTTGDPLRRFCAGSATNVFPRVQIRGAGGSFPQSSTVVMRPGETPRLYDAARDSYNFAPSTYLSTPSETMSFGVNGHYEITDWLRVRAEGSYSNRQSEQQLAPMPVTNISIAADNPFNPFGTSVRVNRRVAEFGPRIYEQDVDTFRFSGGFEGDLPDMGSVSNVKWDLFYTYGRSQSSTGTKNVLNLQRLNTAITPTLCASDAACPKGVNFFSTGPLPQAFFDYVGWNVHDRGENVVKTINGDINGDLFRLPAGPVGFAAGFEYRDLAGNFNPDSLRQAGLSSDTNAKATAGRYFAKEAYTEFRVPLVADAPFVEELTASLAGRYSDFSNFGSKATYKLGLDYAPNSDIRFRTVYGTGFRAPNLGELYGGAAGNFPTGDDPCAGLKNPNAQINAACRALGLGPNYSGTGGQVETIDLSNPKLKAEESKNLTIGTVITPSFLSNFTATVDYWQIKVTDAIDYETTTGILTRCLLTPTGPGCSGVSRDTDGSLLTVTRTYQNLSALKTAGIDFGVNYRFDLGGEQTVDLGTDWTYLLKFNRQVDPLSPIQKLAGTVSVAEDGFGGSHTRWRGNVRGTYQNDWYSFTWTQRLIGPADQYDLGLNRKVTSAEATSTHVGWYTYSDVQASARYEGYSLTIGVNNLWNKKPPYLSAGNQDLNLAGATSAASNTDYNTYDTMGRYLYARIGARF